MQALTLDEVRRELRKYIHSEDLINCHKIICANLNINRALEELFQDCPYLNPSRASYSPKVNFIWILYFRNTSEVLWLNIEEIRVNELQQRIQQLLESNDYGDTLCLEIYIIPINNQNKLKEIMEKFRAKMKQKFQNIFHFLEKHISSQNLFNKKKNKLREVIEFFKDKIRYVEQIKKENYEKILEKIWENQIIIKPWQIIKAFTGELVKPIILIPIILFLYTVSYIIFIHKLGLPFIYISETSPDLFLKFILSFALIIITIYFLIPYSILLGIFFILLGLIIKRFSSSLLLGIINLFKFYFSLIILIILFFLFWTPINFILNETKLTFLSYKPLTELAQKAFFASLAYQQSITDYPLLRKINGKNVLIFGVQKNLIYYYSLNNLAQEFQKNLYPVLKRVNKVKDFCKYINIKKEKLNSTNITYFIFFLPAYKYNIYPLAKKQKELLQFIHVKDAKIENLNESEVEKIYNQLIGFCNETNFKKNKEKTSSQSSQNKTSTKQGT